MFKDHFVAILCGADTSFPLNLWDLLLHQAKHILNMLQPSRMTPTVSAYTYLWGQHDYNANPFAPLGCKVESHLVPSIRETWAPHTASGYYIGTSWEHYHCHKVYVQFGILQAQISHDAILNDSACPHPSSRQSHNCTGRSYPTAQHDHQSHCATHQYLQDTSQERERRGNSSKGAQREGTS